MVYFSKYARPLRINLKCSFSDKFNIKMANYLFKPNCKTRNFTLFSVTESSFQLDPIPLMLHQHTVFYVSSSPLQFRTQNLLIKVSSIPSQ